MCRSSCKGWEAGRESGVARGFQGKGGGLKSCTIENQLIMKSIRPPTHTLCNSGQSHPRENTKMVDLDR